LSEFNFRLVTTDRVTRLFIGVGRSLLSTDAFKVSLEAPLVVLFPSLARRVGPTPTLDPGPLTDLTDARRLLALGVRLKSLLQDRIETNRADLRLSPQPKLATLLSALLLAGRFARSAVAGELVLLHALDHHWTEPALEHLSSALVIAGRVLNESFAGRATGVGETRYLSAIPPLTLLFAERTSDQLLRGLRAILRASLTSWRAAKAVVRSGLLGFLVAVRAVKRYPLIPAL